VDAEVAQPAALETRRQQHGRVVQPVDEVHQLAEEVPRTGGGHRGDHAVPGVERVRAQLREGLQLPAQAPGLGGQRVRPAHLDDADDPAAGAGGHRDAAALGEGVLPDRRQPAAGQGRVPDRVALEQRVAGRGRDAGRDVAPASCLLGRKPGRPGERQRPVGPGEPHRDRGRAERPQRVLQDGLRDALGVPRREHAAFGRAQPHRDGVLALRAGQELLRHLGDPVLGRFADDVRGELQRRQPRALRERLQLPGGVGRRAVQAFHQDALGELDQRAAVGDGVGVVDLAAQAGDGVGEPGEVGRHLRRRHRDDLLLDGRPLLADHAVTCRLMRAMRSSASTGLVT
jgi:hypothetical protein